MAFFVVHVEKQGFVADDVGVLQFFYIYEVLLEVDDVFAVYLEGLGREKFA